MNVSKPKNLAETVRFLSEHPGAKIVAGGTDLLPRINQKLEAYDILCYIDDLPEMSGVSIEKDGGAFIGASVRLAEIPSVKGLSGYTALHQAASKVASPQIRNQATIGGNILQENRCMYFNNQVPWSDVNHCFKWGGKQCFQYKRSKECVALFQSDVAPVLMAFNGVAVIYGPGGRREMPVGELYLKAGRKNIAPNEILLGIQLPALVKGEYSAYVRKTIRGSFDFPLLSCAVRIRIGEHKVIKEVKTVFGSAGIMPSEFKVAAEVMTGKKADELTALADALKPAIPKVISPFQDTRVNGAVRSDMAKGVFAKAIVQIKQTAGIL